MVGCSKQKGIKMIEYYIGTEGPTVLVEDVKEVYEALDIIHTQVLDNFQNSKQILKILERAMDELASSFPNEVI